MIDIEDKELIETLKSIMDENEEEEAKKPEKVDTDEPGFHRGFSDLMDKTNLGDRQRSGALRAAGVMADRKDLTVE